MYRKYRRVRQPKYIRKPPQLPRELVAEIGQWHWKLWGNMRITCKALWQDLNRVIPDPYAAFTHAVITDDDLDQTHIQFITCEGTVIREVCNSICGFIGIQYRGRYNYLYDYNPIWWNPPFNEDRRRPLYVGTDYIIYSLEKRVDLNSFIVWYAKESAPGLITTKISEEEWKRAVANYDALIKVIITQNKSKTT